MAQIGIFARVTPDTSIALDHYLADRTSVKKYEVVELALRNFLRESGASIDESADERKLRRKVNEAFVG